MPIARPERRDDRSKGLALATAGIVALSPESLLIRLVAADRWTVVFWRGLFLAIALLGGVAVRSGDRIKRIGKAGLLIGVMLGSQSVLFVYSITNTTVANTLVALSAAPLVTALIERILFGQRPPRRTWLFIGLAMAGITIMFTGTLGGGHMIGNLAALLASAGYGGVLVVIRRNRDVSMVPAIGFSGLVQLLLVSPLADPLSASISDLRYLALSGLVVLPLGFGLLSIAPRFAPAPEVGLVTLLETVLGPFWVWLALGEQPGLWPLIGGVVVIAAVAGNSVLPLKRPIPVQGEGVRGR